MLGPLRSRSARRKTDSGEPRTLRERGAAALEFALIAPLFFLVVFGGIEIGYMFRSHLTLQDTARVAARVASVERASDQADRAIMERIQVRAQDLNGDVERVVIFAADTLDAQVPEECTRPGDASSNIFKCNVYVVPPGDSLQDVIDSFATNDIGLVAADRQPWDNIGVHIQYDYNLSLIHI